VILHRARSASLTGDTAIRIGRGGGSSLAGTMDSLIVIHEAAIPRDLPLVRTWAKQVSASVRGGRSPMVQRSSWRTSSRGSMRESVALAKRFENVRHSQNCERSSGRGERVSGTVSVAMGRLARHFDCM
jgi:hypothetical protein